MNELCVNELEKELRAKTATESSQIWEISNLKKELKKQQIKLQCYENNKNDKKNTPPSKKVDGEKKKVEKVTPEELNSTAVRMTRYDFL